MKKEIIEITIKCERENQFKPHYLSSQRTFIVHATRGRLFQTLDAIERKLKKLYPEEKELPIPNETKIFGPAGDGNNVVDSEK